MRKHHWVKALLLTATIVLGLYQNPGIAADSSNPPAVRHFVTSATLTTANLGSNGVYTSPWQDATSTGQRTIMVTAYAAQSGSFVVQLAANQSQTAFTSQTFSVTGGTPFNTGFIPIYTRYWRVVYTNGGTAQTSFELDYTAQQGVAYQTDSSGNVKVNCVTGCSGGSGGGSLTTTTYPSPAPNPSPGATGNPLYSDTNGNLYTAPGPNSQGTTSGAPLYATDPNNHAIAQDSNGNQGVYLAGAGQGTSSSAPLYFTDPNTTNFNLDSNKNVITVGNGPNSQNFVMQSYQGGMEIEGSTSVSTTAVSISMTNAYYKISLWNTGASPAYCNLTATATASITGGILLPASMSLPFEVYWKTSGASTVSCITSTGITTIQAIAFR